MNQMEEIEKAKQDGLALMEEYERTLLQNFECIPCAAENVTHDGILLRKCFMPKGSFACGHEHKRSCWNIVLTGSAVVSLNGKSCKIQAGDIFVSEAGVRKGLFIVEDMEFMTIHHNSDNEIDNDKLEDRFVKKSNNFHQLGFNKRTEVKALCLGEK